MLSVKLEITKNDDQDYVELIIVDTFYLDYSKILGYCFA